MFCPLCQAEFRQGFAECSDCKVPLVGTRDEARDKRVSVWKGDSERKLDVVLDALAGAGIPYHYSEGLSSVPKIEFSTVPVRPRFEMEVWVSSEDQERGESAIRELDRNAAEEEGDDDETPTGSTYCPLCKAEYRPGFSECSDCHTTLVGTKSQARKAGVISLWRGTDKRRLEDVLSVLQEANIPLRFREHIKVQPSLQAAIFGINLTRKQSTFESEFEVQVLASDAGRARLAMSQAQLSDEN
jgi:hypothetical protein